MSSIPHSVTYLSQQAQECQQAQTDSGRNGSDVNPETEPRDHHNQNLGYVGGDQIRTDQTLQR